MTAVEKPTTSLADREALKGPDSLFQTEGRLSDKLEGHGHGVNGAAGGRRDPQAPPARRPGPVAPDHECTAQR